MCHLHTVVCLFDTLQLTSCLVTIHLLTHGLSPFTLKTVLFFQSLDSHKTIWHVKQIHLKMAVTRTFIYCFVSNKKSPTSILYASVMFILVKNCFVCDDALWKHIIMYFTSWIKICGCGDQGKSWIYWYSLIFHVKNIFLINRCIKV